MSDQPTTSMIMWSMPTNHRMPGDQPSTDQPTTPPLLTLEETAADLGITVNAVRQRLKRGTVTGIKTEPRRWWIPRIEYREEVGIHGPNKINHHPQRLASPS